MSVLGLLVTGRPDGIDRFHQAICFLLNAHKRIGQTVHYSCMEEHLEQALVAARIADVTVQKIVTVGKTNERKIKLGGGASATVSDCIEEYPVLHLASDGAKWSVPA